MRCTNGSKPRGHQAAAVLSSEPDTTTCAPIPSSSVSREPARDTSLNIVETTAPPLSQALPLLAANAPLTSQQCDTAMALRARTRDEPAQRDGRLPRADHLCGGKCDTRADEEDPGKVHGS